MSFLLLRKSLRALQARASRLYHLWQSLQVSYRGSSYSVERMLTLDEYIRNTSLVRVYFVVAGTMVPMVVLVLSQESLPLRDPRDGWRVNYGFWMRVGIMAGVVSSTLAVQAKFMVHPANFTSCKLTILFISLSLSYPVVSMGIAALVGFPIPFFALSTIPIFFVLLAVWFTVIFGKKAVHEMLERKEEMVTYVKFICAQMLMPAVYPVYEVIFGLASDTYYELPVIMLLPIIKIVMKYIVTLALVRREDMMPEAVIFTVEFFHAVYLATCMQRTRSITTIAIIIIIDVSQSVSMLYGLHRRSRTTLARAHRAAGVIKGNESLVTALRIICSSSERIGKQNLDGIRVSSCLPHLLSSVSKHLLSRMGKLQQENHAPRSSSQSFLSGSGTTFIRVIPIKNQSRISRVCFKLRRWRQNNGVRPIVPTSTLPWTIEARHLGRQSSRHNSLVYGCSNILREGLEALFTSECLVLASYLHTSIAMFYVNYTVVMVYLPSAQYHTELRGVTRGNVVDSVESVFIFGMLGFISFSLLTAMMKYKYGIRALYHVAFVLETQMALIQGKVMMWMLIILCFRVVHFGVDFTLQFAWIRDPSGS